MDTNIKQYADSRNLKALKYIFVDALDADPTFEQYEEAYNYCKSIPGLLEIHAELTPFVYDRTQWTESYWNALKMDLITNFSDRRMMHNSNSCGNSGIGAQVTRQPPKQISADEHIVFSNNAYTFTVSPSWDKMYRYTNDMTEKWMFKCAATRTEFDEIVTRYACEPVDGKSVDGNIGYSLNQYVYFRDNTKKYCRGYMLIQYNTEHSYCHDMFKKEEKKTFYLYISQKKVW